MKDFEIPFKTKFNRIAIEVDGSYHYVQNLESLSMKSEDYSISTTLKLEVPNQQNIKSSSRRVMKLPDELSIPFTGSYESGATHWKQNIIQSWFRVNIPVHEFKLWINRGALTTALMNCLPIKWDQWKAQIETLKELATREKELNKAP